MSIPRYICALTFMYGVSPAQLGKLACLFGLLGSFQGSPNARTQVL